MKRLLIVALLVLASGKAAADWTVISISGDGGTVWLYDPGRVRRSDAAVEVWIKVVGDGFKNYILDYYRRNRAPQSTITTFEQRFSYGLDQWRIDCKRWTNRLLNSSTYDAQGSMFDSLPDSVTSNLVPSAIVPDSLMDGAAEKLCKR